MNLLSKIWFVITRVLLYIIVFFSNEKIKGKIYSLFLDMKIGKNCRFVARPRFGSEPYLVELGDGVRIARGVSFITHDGGLSLFREEYPGINYFAKIKVGNNVVLGLNSIILPGVTIGNNVIVGSGSIVNKDVPDNVIVAGVPAKIISSIEDYKLKSLQNACYLSEPNYWKRKKRIISFLNNRK